MTDLSEISDNDSALWRIAKDSHAELSSRIAAIQELAHVAEDDVAQYLVEELELRGGPESLQWREAVIALLNRVQCRGPERRERLRNALLKYLSPGDLRRPPIIWSALRRFGAVGGVLDLPCLLPFLGADLRTRQAALQAIQAIAVTNLNCADSRIAEVTRRVDALAEKYLDPDWVISGEHASVALNALLASVALWSPLAAAHAVALLALRSSSLVRLAQASLSDQGLVARDRRSGVDQEYRKNLIDLLSRSELSDGN